ncbi:hypothetical protein PIB30_024424 [Stylosanthes scabra]|uniref:Uncharacterized protein n=1 Tax=Stylosanthes scabra TaxID=79078 RepID=A0ABU6V9Z2_9FABA|nr:hypothetical protein [Stylosanthes scabra]
MPQTARRVSSRKKNNKVGAIQIAVGNSSKLLGNRMNTFISRVGAMLRTGPTRPNPLRHVINLLGSLVKDQPKRSKIGLKKLTTKQKYQPWRIKKFEGKEETKPKRSSQEKLLHQHQVGVLNITGALRQSMEDQEKADGERSREAEPAPFRVGFAGELDGSYAERGSAKGSGVRHGNPN